MIKLGLFSDVERDQEAAFFLDCEFDCACFCLYSADYQFIYPQEYFIVLMVGSSCSLM